jgi:hypothetical protein
MSLSQGSHRGAAIADVEECRRRLRQLLDAEEAIEDDETARQKMRNAEVYERGVTGTVGEYVGFDPDNVADVKNFTRSVIGSGVDYNVIKPMGYFAYHGDLPMMRWLYVNGADTRDEDVAMWFPMWAVAGRWSGYGTCMGQLCKWLFEHGAAENIKRPTRVTREIVRIDVTRPLTRAFSPLRQSRRNLIKWFILNGALCKDDNSGDLDIEKMRKEVGHVFRGCEFEKELRCKRCRWCNIY